MTTVPAQSSLSPADDIGGTPVDAVLREIARGGIAGAIAGALAAGLGGRVLMRVIALLHPEAIGRTTENGNSIGDITLVGTLGLVLFGLALGLVAGTVWVISRPWIPGHGLRRAVLTVPLALVVGTPALIQEFNLDFSLVRHDPLVVVLLVTLVGVVGASIALLDGWLDARLPRASAHSRRPTQVYGLIAILGVIAVLPLTALELLASDEYDAPIRTAVGLVVVGLCTLAWWLLTLRGRAVAPPALTLTARIALVATFVLGLVNALPHVAGAAGV
ncbi:MAG: hypothetical protein ABIZ34_09290 [Candidatus Limnocylindrales bacterium]